MYLKKVHFFEYEEKDRKKQWSEKTGALEKRSESKLPEKFEEDGEKASSIRSRNTGVVILRDKPTPT